MSIAPPTIPTSLQIYNSYVEDPIWQGKFTAIWCSCLGAVLVVSFPSLVHALKHGRALVGFFGISGAYGRREYSAVISEEKTSPSPSQRPSVGRKTAAYWNAWASICQWSVLYLDLNAGQIFVLAAYLAITLVCIIKDAPLVSNPNRAGFLALAQFPIVFLFATKNSFLSLLLGPGHGYEKLNFLHRMAGRVMFLAAAIHGSLWIRNHIQYDIPILGPQKETSGVASLAMLGCIVLFSLRPIRRLFYQAFFVIHVLTFVAFFVCVCYHSIYAPPWIFPPLAFYGADMFLRLLRYRFKDATMTAPDEFMTFVRVHECDKGWIAGQHVCLRVFFSGRLLESHPLSILSAPPAYSCLSNPGLLLSTRVNGDWTGALNTFVRREQERLVLMADTCKDKDKDKDRDVSVPVQVMIDGPYGGSSVDLGQYETVLLVSGGSGITFTLGLLDDIVGRCVKLRRRGGERTRRIEFVWCIRSFGHITWFAPMLTDIANTAVNSSIDLHMSIFVTCLCQPEAVPLIPNCDVTLTRPSVYGLLQDLTSPRSASSSSSSVEEDGKQFHGMGQIETSGHVGGVAVCASGPASLTMEAQNAVARLGVVRGIEVGGVAIHVEQFTL
ncbi:iron reductase [Butyriboletus roseoflavus]|nr:iron reductase [Butyriboletus roseoflavus]